MRATDESCLVHASVRCLVKRDGYVYVVQMPLPVACVAS